MIMSGAEWERGTQDDLREKQRRPGLPGHPPPFGPGAGAHHAGISRRRGAGAGGDSNTHSASLSALSLE